MILGREFQREGAEMEKVKTLWHTLLYRAALKKRRCEEVVAALIINSSNL